MNSADIEPLIKRVGAVLVATIKGPYSPLDTAANNQDVSELADIVHDLLWLMHASVLKHEAEIAARNNAILPVGKPKHYQLTYALGAIKEATPHQLAELLTADTIAFLAIKLEETLTLVTLARNAVTPKTTTTLESIPKVTP